MTTNSTNAPDKTACVIVAGGSGSRIGGAEPKQFRLLGGEPVLSHSVQHFGNHSGIDRVIVVVPQPWITRTMELLEHVETAAPLTIVAGGARRQDSVYAGVSAAEDCVFVAVHDGARPFPPENLDEGLRAAKATGGAIFAMPATDSIKRVVNGQIGETVPRRDLWAAQTPQIFHRAKLLSALEACDSDGAEVTDDASAFEHMKWPVAIVTGSRSNLKITYNEDFTMAEALLKGRNV